jgi:hypothetical protein
MDYHATTAYNHTTRNPGDKAMTPTVDPNEENDDLYECDMCGGKFDKSDMWSSDVCKGCEEGLEED